MKTTLFSNKLISLGSISSGRKGRIPWSRHRATSCWSWRLCGTLHLSSSRVVPGQIWAIWDPLQNPHILTSLEPFVFRFIGEAKTQASYLLPLSSLSLETLAGVRENYFDLTNECINECRNGRNHLKRKKWEQYNHKSLAKELNQNSLSLIEGLISWNLTS